ncbi:hypothetical protein ACJX0J_019708, partial [Zea mays]
MLGIWAQQFILLNNLAVFVTPIESSLKLEPFTSLYLNFQVGGKFDHADHFFLKIQIHIILFLLMLVIFVIILYNCILHFHRSTDRLLRKSYAHHPHYDVSAFGPFGAPPFKIRCIYIMVTAEAGLKIRVVARETNEELRAIKADPAEGFDIGAILSIAKRELNSEHEATRIEALHWFFTLLDRYCAE